MLVEGGQTACEWRGGVNRLLVEGEGLTRC